jgi:hypothetical protein
MIHITRNGPIAPGMYGLTEPEPGGSGVVRAIRNDVDLCEKLRLAGIDEPTTQEIASRLLHKDDYASLEREASGGWTVTFGNKKTG